MYLPQEDNMDLWVTADTHFGYDGVNEGIERPKNFSEKILSGLGNVLKPESATITSSQRLRIYLDWELAMSSKSFDLVRLDAVLLHSALNTFGGRTLEL